MNEQGPNQHDSQPPELDLRPLPGSERPPAAGFSAAAAALLHAEATVQATVVLRRQREPGADAFSAPLDPAAAAAYGASTDDLDLVTSTLSGLGVRVLDADAASRRVRISGSAELMGRIFGTELQLFDRGLPSGETVTHRHRTGGLSVPAVLDGVVTAVLGLDNRPQTRALFRIAPSAARATSYTPLDLGRIYNFPADFDGSGESIAIIELGGGFDQADLDAYFRDLGIQGPVVTAVGVDGADNQPGQDPSGADGEVLLDIEVAGAMAPGAAVVVYFAPNTDDGFLDAIAQAAHAEPTPAAISISWGQSEDDWTPQARTAFDQAMADASILGVTVTAAAGDDGSTDRATDAKAHVDFPASSPHALACGGTRLEADAGTGTVNSETVWNNGASGGATGGGVSGVFALPPWQSNSGVPELSGKTGRGVPDVSAVADPQTGYKVRVDGRDMVIGGTSAVSPLWAALIARLTQATGTRLGLTQPLLYAQSSGGAVPAGFRDITSGNNGAYSAGPGWDACTGLGVPDGTKLLALLQQSAGSGTRPDVPGPGPGPGSGSATA
ncbi:S8 family serine peptidase [Paenarthrobacter sp. Z7-10]|uniref:S53 family peptidase n=1 Tax=Paenarthrobacter sp. Z7-10 TaxID=2787635 RepID=UPI0022A9C436|nr:S53 family peptidase [Paenarthrobacter sp. Z7-10]MCZ2404007.1 S8 family serine peptidase [Paenarthrobacter sp. Z7-10]